MRTSAWLLGLSLAAQCLCAPSLCASTEIHVSTVGSDSADGSIESPVRSVYRAHELARQSRQSNPEQTIEIIVHSGEYFLSQPLTLSREDSGRSDAPLVFRAAEGEVVMLSGATSLQRIGLARNEGSYRGLLPQSAHDNVVIFSVPEASEAAWMVAPRGEDHGLEPCSLELFSGNRSLPRAAFPESGWSRNVEADSIASRVKNHNGEQAWLHGFPRHDYQDEFLPLATNDRGWREGARFRIENLLCQLQSPNQWYMDCENKRVLWWPSEVDESDLRLSNLETLISLYDASNVRFEGFILEGARVQAVEIVGGSSVEIENCHIRHIGNVGVHVFHGFYHSISNCEIHSIGSSGIRVEGGESDGDLPSEHLCFKNELYDCSTKHLARRAAIEVHGQGVAIVENEIHDQPDWAISLCGSGHNVQSNHIHRVCTQTSDTGAIYLTGELVQDDNLISLNHIHHVGEYDQKNTFAIYLDDNASHTEVSANWIHDASRAIVVRGGSNNRIEANIVHDCWIGAQFEWTERSTDNQLVSNVLEAHSPLVVSQSQRQSLTTENNVNSTAGLFKNARAGNFEFNDQPLAIQMGLDRWPLARLPKGFERFVSTDGQ